MAPSKPTKFNKRRSTLKNKAQQLQTLSDVMVCMVCFGADGEVTTWPEDKSQVHQTIKYKLAQFSERSKEKLKNHKCNLNLLGFLGSKKRKLQKSNKQNPQKKKKDIGNLFANWKAKLDKLQEKELVALCNCLESKLRDLREKIKLLGMKDKEKGKAIQVYGSNGDNKELNLESQQEVFASPSGFCSHSGVLWRWNSENLVLCGENCNENYVGNCYEDFLTGVGSEDIGFVGESSNNILNPGDSMLGQRETTPTHEALPMSMRQSPWPFSNELAY
ncbi:hypothetical protein Pint_14043 [Pistacia integerrima]|uniref:Uncharacterized protein n=1 Tax=Pistacia integerrima TaxID=434235 RepID=A0ACC0Y8Y9_9ROSI|nr:hypothetical protein Pint_14043 [Pistacia integerrima]